MHVYTHAHNAWIQTKTYHYIVIEAEEQLAQSDTYVNTPRPPLPVVCGAVQAMLQSRSANPEALFLTFAWGIKCILGQPPRTPPQICMHACMFVCLRVCICVQM